jgi:anti-anti-sigma factor
MLAIAVGNQNLSTRPARDDYTSAETAWRAGPITELQRLTVSLRGGCDKTDQALVFGFTGQLDAYSDKQFSAYIAEHSQGASLPLIIDLSRIDFIDSSGLGALVQLVKNCKESGTQFALIGNARVVQTLKLVRLEAFLNLQPSLADALAQFGAA